ncbi:MAG: hypothetical protein IT547_19015, partial [Hyphomonadaceae bacterium]|nr:hypothetical protein [Hyphomonadaceae bacterium]
MAWPYEEEEISNQVEAFLSPSERHHNATAEQVLLDPMLRGWVADVYAALQVLESNPSSASALSELDRVRAELDRASPIIERLVGDVEAHAATQIAAMRTLADEAQATATAASSSADVSHAAAAAAEALAEAARAELAETAAAMETLRGKTGMAESAVATARAQVNIATADAVAARAEAEAAKAETMSERRRAEQAIAQAVDLRAQVEAVASAAANEREAAEKERASLTERTTAAEAAVGQVLSDMAAVQAANKSQAEQAGVMRRRVIDLTTQLDDARARATSLESQVREGAAALEAMRQASNAEITRLRDLVAQREMHLHAIGSSTSWKLTRPIRGIKRLFSETEFRRQLPYRLARSVARRIGVPVLWRARAKAWAAKFGLIYTGPPLEIAPAASPAPVVAVPRPERPQTGPDGSRYSILWVVNDSDLQTQKYRVFNYASELARHNVRSFIVREAELNGVDPAGYSIVVFNRIAANDRTAALVTRCRELGIPLRYDVDDLVFDADRLHLLRFTSSLTPDEFKLFRDGCVSRRDLMLQCDFVTVSTPELGREVRALGLPAYILPNTISRADLEEFGTNRPLRQMSKPARVRIAYFSGTRTHADDFACCAEALARVLRENANAELMVVGELDLPPAFQTLKDRVIVKPLMSHVAMLRELADVD